MKSLSITTFGTLSFIPDGWVYIEIRKGMYVLPQAGILKNQLLEERLATKAWLGNPLGFPLNSAIILI